MVGRVMFTGPRDLYVPDSIIGLALLAYQPSGSYMELPDVVVVGDATGIDHCVRNWALAHGYVLGESLFVHRAQWKTKGKGAGHIRNGEMVEDVGVGGEGGRCVAIRDSGRTTPGTTNAIEQAVDAGLHTTAAIVEALNAKDKIKFGMRVCDYEQFSSGTIKLKGA